MSVHYKFKSTLNFDTITFDGLHISVADLKREIVQQKRLGKIIDFDLQITNAQTKEEYKDDNFLIPKNTTLIISRIPIAHPVKKGWDPPADNASSNAPSSKADNINMDLFKMQGSEEDKIQAMMMQSTADYDPKTYHRIKGQSQVGEVPASYRCNKCKRGGHWIKNCSFSSGKEQFEVKRTTGIPRSFRGKEIPTEQETSKFIASTEKDQEIPEDLICGICRNIFVDAVMIPCCGSSFCDDCVRNSLLESEDSECPDCKEKNCSPGSLIPNRFLRNSVNVFKNESGYKLAAFKPVTKVNPVVEKKEEDPVPEQEPIPDESKQTEQTEADNISQPQQPIKTEEQNVTKNINNTNTNSTDSVKKEKDKFDSDYEDNITITMPQKVNNTLLINADTNKEQSVPSYSHKSHGNNVHPRREANIEYKPEMEKKHQSYDNNERIRPQNERSLLPTPVGTHHKYANMNMSEQREPNTDQSRHMGLYKPAYIQMPPRCPTMIHMPPYNNNGYNNMPHRPPISFGHYQNQAPVHQMNTSYMPGANININPSQTFQSTNLASIYQGVAAKVGTGLIDDPLEAFNRIMKEKEKQKSDRRRSPVHHRSRSPGRLRHRFKSPVYDRGSSREMIIKEKRPRSRERKREYSYERRQSRATRHSSHGSNSPSDKKKRYMHRRSPSPKSNYKSRPREKSVTKPYAPKPDTVEPPPPGFESLQIESLADNDMNFNNKAIDTDVDRDFHGQTHSAKRPRTYSSNNVDIKTVDHISRSLTPPAKSRILKASRDEIKCADMYESPPKTPDRREQHIHIKLEKPQSTQLLNLENDTSAVHSEDHLESNNNMEKENNIQLKDRKKKKKVKSERKKSKKDKKEKKDKNKKSHSESIEPAPEKFSVDNLNMNPCDEIAESHTNHSNQKILSNSLDLDTLKNNEPILNIEVTTDHDLDRDNIDVNDVQLSKWELDDSSLTSNLFDPCRKVSSSNKMQDHSEITSDVIRKAENAIFAKAINAIRPVEFKVVIDTKHNSKDTTISLKTDCRDRSHSPKSSATSKSVKERLGNKVVRERDYSSDRSKTNQRENSGRHVSVERNKHSSGSYSSRTREKDSKERIRVTTERKYEDSRNPRKSSHERSDSQKHKSQFKDKSSTRDSSRSEKRNYDSDRNSHGSRKTGETRLISSIASRPCRPDNPFRKFDENHSSSRSKVSKYDNSIKRDVTPLSPSDETEYKKRKDKKLKKLKKCSSTESVKSEKRKDVKSKKKSKILKKKKKSRK
ncbi:E3 ubiquitin-protein ligase RBBP6 [Drosophila grimshawi]|uniref:GH21725 n=1 Tax=Drosophila grimshawi TaxID=7222 RepID=B4J6F7_DROGR|nr:E3 ubiquitin-protein ligase RBBP6 [Drosophila grimshawi]EDW01958.1 GH21725 [Drosophila grimshawi]